jgi:hypothetical protein
MVSASELVDEAERRGARFRVIGDRLEGTPATAFDAKLDRAIGEQKAEVIALLRERDATDSALFAQALLRQGQFARELAPCDFHCGHADERCRRCRAPFAEHYQPFGNESRQ